MFVDFSKAFDSILIGELEQVLLTYGVLEKKSVTAVMMFYSNMEVMVRAPDGVTDFFNIVAGVL